MAQFWQIEEIHFGSVFYERVHPAPTIVNSVTATGSQVTVNWNAVSNASQYDVYILQAPWRWEDIKYSATSWGTSHTFSNISNGNYAAFVITRPNDNYAAQSNWFYFKVEPPAWSRSYITEPSLFEKHKISDHQK